MKSTAIFFSVGGRVMKKLHLTNPPLHLPDCGSDKSPLIWNMVLSRKCDWFMHRVTVSHNAAAAIFYVWSEDEFLSAHWSNSQEVWDCLWVSVDRRVAGDQQPGIQVWGAANERDELFLLPEGLKALKRFSLRFVFAAIFNLQHESVLDLVHGGALLRGSSPENWAGSWPLSLGIWRVEGKLSWGAVADTDSLCFPMTVAKINLSIGT